MKKISILMLGALGLMAASCAEDITPAIPQSNPQEPILEAGDIATAVAGPLANTSSVLNLQSYNTPGATIEVMRVGETKDLPAGAVVTANVQLCADPDFAGKVVTLEGENTNDVVSVSAEAWNDAHIALFGKSPKVKDVYFRVPVYAVVANSNYRYRGLDYFAGQGMLQETCMDAGFTISETYYFLSNATSWKLDEMTPAFAFAHSDADVYDDPVFTYKFEVTQDVLDATGGGCYWKIGSAEAVAANSMDAGIYGTDVDGDPELAGMLTDANPQAGKLTEPGKYKLVINMEQMTYEFTLLLQPEFLYTPGGANGWKQLESAYMMLMADMGFYCALMPIDAAGFKITEEPNWDYKEGNWGADPQEAGKFLAGDEGANIMVETPGMYWVKANFDPKTYALTTYELTQITTVGMIGSMTQWGDEIAMTSEDGGATWVGEVEFPAGAEFKFRFNGDWAYNYGGSLDNLVFDASNLKADEAGTYVVTLKLQPGLPTATMVLK